MQHGAGWHDRAPPALDKVEAITRHDDDYEHDSIDIEYDLIWLFDDLAVWLEIMDLNSDLSIDTRPNGRFMIPESERPQRGLMTDG